MILRSPQVRRESFGPAAGRSQQRHLCPHADLAGTRRELQQSVSSDAANRAGGAR